MPTDGVGHSTTVGLTPGAQRSRWPLFLALLIPLFVGVPRQRRFPTCASDRADRVGRFSRVAGRALDDLRIGLD